MTPDEVTLEKALALLSLPRELGPHPEDGEPILAGVGRFGPYVKHGAKYKSIPADESVLDIGMNRAVALLAEAKAVGPRPRRQAAARASATIPPTRRRSSSTTAATAIYVKHGGINATVPRDLKPEELTRRPGGVAAGRARGQGRRQEAARPVRAKKTAAASPANDAGDTPRQQDQGRQEEGGAQAQGRQGQDRAPPRTGTDG